MTKLKFLTILMLATCSCGKKSELAYYKDSQYPFSIGYFPQKMVVEPFLENKDNHRVKIEVDLSEEFPEDLTATEVPRGLYDVIVYKNQASFISSNAINSSNAAETTLDGIPAIGFKTEEGEFYGYILLVPKIYLEIWLFGHNSRYWNPTDISQQLSDRVEELTYEMIKHFKWNQKIDTDSEEFKAWKAHIWDILKTPREKVKTQ